MKETVWRKVDIAIGMHSCQHDIVVGLGQMNRPLGQCWKQLSKPEMSRSQKAIHSLMGCGKFNSPSLPLLRYEQGPHAGVKRVGEDPIYSEASSNAVLGSGLPMLRLVDSRTGSIADWRSTGMVALLGESKY